MERKPQYHKETQPTIFQGKPATVIHLTPVLSAEQRDKRKREVEHQLYEVFSKYKDEKRKMQ